MTTEERIRTIFGAVVVVAVLVGGAVALHSSTRPPVSSPEVHIRDLGKVGGQSIYSVTDLEKGTLCYVSKRGGISCLPDQ